MNIYNESLTDLEARLRTILPELYQDSYEDIEPVSMGSAALKFDKSGAVEWGEMWDTFCDLAMAGGPPHKGSLLSPGTAEDVRAHSGRYDEVIKEMRRGIKLVAGLKAGPSKFPGWLRVECVDNVMAEWLVRAITMENVSCHSEGKAIFLPAAPTYRVEKEIKNVITVIAKTCHYWMDHMWMSQQREIAALFAALAVETPLLRLPFPRSDLPVNSSLLERITQSLASGNGPAVVAQSQGWLGVECASVHSAVWIMRGMVATNVLARREGTVLFLPLNQSTDPDGERMQQTLAHIWRLARAAQVLT